MKKFIFACALLGMSSISFAQDAGETIVNRQKLMKQLGGIAKELNNNPSDIAVVNKLGSDIQKIAADLKNLFPAGTSEDEVKKPENAAKAKIWTEKAKFEEILAKLGGAGMKISQSKTIDEATGAVKAMGGETCKACHDVYRTKS